MTDAPQRLALPAQEQWSAQQREASARIRSGPRGALFGPFETLLHAPELMTRVQQVGEYLRFSSSVSNDLFELAILTVAHHWRQEFEWNYHCPLAVAAGVPRDVIEEVAAGRRPVAAAAALVAIWDFVRALLEDGGVSDDVFAAVEVLGDEVVVELITTVGYYTTLALAMNVARTPPASIAADLPRLGL